MVRLIDRTLSIAGKLDSPIDGIMSIARVSRIADTWLFGYFSGALEQRTVLQPTFPGVEVDIRVLVGLSISPKRTSMR